MPPTKSPRKWTADLALAGITFIWGATFVVVKEALDNISTLLFLAIRFTIATVALGIAFRPLPSKFSSGRPLVTSGMLAGTCLFAGYFFQTVGLKYTSASKSAFITGLSIIMVPVFAGLLARRAPRFTEGLGVIAAALGMGLLTLHGGTGGANAGDVLTFFCAVAFAVHILLIGRYSPRFGFAPLALTQIATSAVLAWSSFWWAETPVLRLRPVVVIALVVTGLLATALAFSVQAWAQQYTTPTRTALIFALEPVFAWGTSWVVAGEVLSVRAATGAILILAGILLVELKSLSARPPA